MGARGEAPENFEISASPDAWRMHFQHLLNLFYRELKWSHDVYSFRSEHITPNILMQKLNRMKTMIGSEKTLGDGQNRWSRLPCRGPKYGSIRQEV